MQEFHNLRDVLDAHRGQVKHLTVLAPANDPFRVDTPAGHRDGVWACQHADWDRHHRATPPSVARHSVGFRPG